MNISNTSPMPSVQFSGWRHALVPVAGLAIVASACSVSPRDAFMRMGDTGITDVETKPDGDTKYTFNTDQGQIEVLVIPSDSLISVTWKDTAVNVTYSQGESGFIDVTSMDEDGRYSQSEIEPAEAWLELESLLAPLIASRPEGALLGVLASLR